MVLLFNKVLNGSNIRMFYTLIGFNKLEGIPVSILNSLFLYLDQLRNFLKIADFFVVVLSKIEVPRDVRNSKCP